MMAFNRVSRIGFDLSKKLVRSRRRPALRNMARSVEVLESRELLSTFLVTNLRNYGAGSFRQAILESNQRPGPNTIDFDVAGTLLNCKTPLPAITNTVTIDGSTAPSYAGSPVVSLNFQGTSGLRFARGSNGSIVRDLSLVNAGNAGITLSASDITVQGNYIGLQSDGKTVAGNHGDGVQINASSHNDIIGQTEAISYYNADAVSMQPVSGWQGIRNSDTSGVYLMTGTSDANGLLYEGPISGVGGTSYSVNYPGAATTSVYGPDDLGGNSVALVGSYKNGDGTVHGFLFEGTTADLSQSGDYTTIDYPSAQYTYVHSTMGGLAVGNADGPEGNAPIGTGHAFVYDIAESTFLTNVVYPGSTSTTAYGIWYNGGTSYTICGGYSTVLSPAQTIGQGYLVDYNSATAQFTNWTSFAYPNSVTGVDYVTHFEGISSPEPGVYTLAADSGQTGSTSVLQGSLVTVQRSSAGTFGPGAWVDLNYPGVPSTAIASANSVAGNQVVGIVASTTGVFSFQATINGFQLSNVISGNHGNGVGIYGSDDNQVAMNFIGTDASGTVALGNSKNGLLVTNGATGNLIGGASVGGNDPTAGVFVRPFLGNLISGNRGDGVLIDNAATQTVLSGNFVGTSASGNSALANQLDGVAIVKANGNELIGCTALQNPFVYYNVVSGNDGNGVRVTDSNDSTIQGDFMGVGANNATIVANGGDGLLVSGSSKTTQVGGVIPLGNVISGNNRNGIEVSGTASGFTSFNTFDGIFAFDGAAPNRLDGTLITSSGGNNLIRTCIVSGNLGNGIELGGNATGVQVTDTAVGTDTNIQTAIPNQGDGILITGHAHDNAIGGFQPSVEPQVTISSNGGYGIAIVGSAHDNIVYHTMIGSNAAGTADLGNTLGGIELGSGTSSNTIGGEAAALQNQILYSGGPGIILQASSGNAVLGNAVRNNTGAGVVVIAGRSNQIGSAAAGNTIAGNGGDGLDVSGLVTGTRVQGNAINGNAGNGTTLGQAQGVTIGGIVSEDGNAILNNQGYGLYAFGVCTGSVVQGNTIVSNTKGNVNLTESRGIKYTP